MSNYRHKGLFVSLGFKFIASKSKQLYKASNIPPPSYRVKHGMTAERTTGDEKTLTPLRVFCPSA